MNHRITDWIAIEYARDNFIEEVETADGPVDVWAAQDLVYGGGSVWLDQSFNMETEGEITLPNGDTIRTGQGGGYHVGSDSYPVTIIGWSKSGKTLYYQHASARHTEDSEYYGTQRYVFTADTTGPIWVATWRRGGAGGFKRKGSRYISISTRGYRKYRDPSF